MVRRGEITMLRNAMNALAGSLARWTDAVRCDHLWVSASSDLGSKYSYSSLRL